MNTHNWFGFIAVPHGADEREPSWITRLMERLTRGETPVDGIESSPEKRGHVHPQEPVRWGNFR